MRATPEEFKLARAALLGARRVMFLMLLKPLNKLNCWRRVQKELSWSLAKGTVPLVAVVMFPPVVMLPPSVAFCAEATAAARANGAIFWKRMMKNGSKWRLWKRMGIV